MQLTFCGAAQIVTGSCYLGETKKTKFLVDCGMFQGPKEITRMNYLNFNFDPKSIDYVFLTHAHIDHSGLIPKLKKQGFKGKIFTTSATIDLCEILFEDSATIQEETIEHENKRREEQGLPPREPLYTREDAIKCMSCFEKVEYEKKYTINEEIEVRYQNAGHIIGSASIELFITEEGQATKKIVFSGDIGQRNVPIIQDPVLIHEADYVLIESTYGNKMHDDVGERDELLKEYVMKTYKKGGKVFVPSFAVERTQEFLYSINKLIQKKEFPPIKVFLDSPLSIKATQVFKKNEQEFDEEALTIYKDPFNFKELVCTPSVEDSLQLNNYKKSCLIIAGNGMCTAGRIRHHLKHGIRNPKNMVLFIGYQAEETAGRYILEGAETVKMLGSDIPVKAEVAKINSFSSHADADELIKRAQGFTKKPKKFFIVHGEHEASEALSTKLQSIGLETHIPRVKECIEL